MEKQKSMSKVKYCLVYLVFAVGTAGHIVNGLSGLMISITPYVLLVTGFYVLFFSGLFKSPEFMKWLAAAYLITLFLEIAGVRTGLIFGEYVYGRVLGFSVSGVPLIIGFNWIIVILGAFSVSRLISDKIIIVSLITGIISVVFDLILEPAAIKLGYWNWLNNTVPVQNYTAWFLISAAAAFSLMKLKIMIYPVLFIHYLFAMTLFFIILNFV